VAALFEKIASAKAPDVFTTRFLADTIGLTSTGDRQLIGLMRNLGFLDSGNKPTAEYAQLKNPAIAAKAIGAAIRRAYAPLFDANENAETLSAPELKGLISQLTGADTAVVAKILGTLQALFRCADFQGLDDADIIQRRESQKEINSGMDPSKAEMLRAGADGGKPPPAALRPEFHYNIQVHLPANGTEETYLHIFNALRRAFSS
jgi:hypothetical protein